MSIDQGKLRWNGWGLAAHADPVESRDEVWTWLAQELGMPSLLVTPPRPLEEATLPASRLSQEELGGLATILGPDRVDCSGYARAYHARGRSYHDLLHLRAGDLATAPDAIVRPRAAEEVLGVLMLANARAIAVVPYGGGSSVVGGVNAKAGPFKAVITLDLSGMDRLLEVDTMSGLARAEVGIAGPALEQALAAKGVTLGHYPQSFEYSTLGGWISHSGAGQQSNRYGRVEDWLVGARLVTPRGILKTEDFPASAAGPRLGGLIIGAEGTFGVIADATVRVRPQPAQRSYHGFLFRDFQSGAAAIRQAVQAGIPAAMLRLSDAQETRFYRTFSQIGKSGGAGSWLAERYLGSRGFDHSACALIAGFEGDREAVDYGRKRFAAIAKGLGALALGEKPGKNWYAGRFHGPYLRDPMMDRGVGVDTLETATHWAGLDRLYTAVRGALEAAIRDHAPMPGAHGVVLCHISHAYPDGASLYFTYIFPRNLDGELAQWRAIKTAASDAIVAHGGTISHHHGVGTDHRAWMTSEKGELGLEVLRAIKTTLDPKGILNPGKLLPE